MNKSEKYKATKLWARFSSTLLFSLVLFVGGLKAQSVTTALPTDGSGAQSVAPQGGFRYQRGFYLIKPSELLNSGLMAGDTINCIGFTLGAAQNDTTKGKFKVYLQNTLDTVSRIDTAWTIVSGILNNKLTVSNLFPANYEWQVKTNCSDYTNSDLFSNNMLEFCQPPTHLVSDSILDMSVALNWVAPAVNSIGYIVEYSRFDTINWISQNTSLTHLTVTGLIPSKSYQWRVKSLCFSDTSDFVSSSFTTLQTDVCSEPVPLMPQSVGDTSALLSWNGAAGATFYTVRFRRAGSSNWQSINVFSDTSVFLTFGLVQGTNYEWQVQTHCGFSILDIGSFVPGTNFMTTGTLACYIPESVFADSISTSSVILTWDIVPGALSYEVRYRAKSVISWQHAINGMMLVHNDSICIPDTIGPYFTNFKLGSDTLSYAGDGLYVAWEYQMPVGTLSSRNSSLSTAANTVLKGSLGQDSINYILSFISSGDSSSMELDTVLASIALRPETKFCSPNLVDSVEILAVHTLGKYAPTFTSAPVTAIIRNYSKMQATYPITLTVKDQLTNTIRYSETQPITIPDDTIGSITFTGWSPSILETDSIIISTIGRANEDVLNNNRKFYIQMVTKSIVSYEDGSQAITQAGTDTAAGFTLSRLLMDGCGVINAVQVFLSQSAEGKQVYAVALDTAKIILGQSPPFTPNKNQVNQYHTFYFQNTRILQNEYYFVGLAQGASTNSCLPVGVQYEAGVIRDSAYFRYNIALDSLYDHPDPGRLMIRAILVPGGVSPLITGDKFLCVGTMDTLIASSLKLRYADSVIYSTSQFNNNQNSAYEALGIPNQYPVYGALNSWLSGSDTGRQVLVLRVPNADSVNYIDIFETYNPGSIDSIYLQDQNTSAFNLVWSGQAAPTPAIAQKHHTDIPLTSYKVSAIRIAFNMTAVPGYSAVDAVCIGRRTTPGIFPNITWTGGSMNDSLIISTPGGYSIQVSDANGCIFKDSFTVITPVQVTPVITAFGPTTICPGDSVKLKSDIIGGNIWSTGEMTDSIYAKAGGAYFVKHDDGSRCDTTMSNTINIMLFAAPMVNVTGDTVICPNGSVTLDAGPGFSSYMWSTGVSSQSINVLYAGTFNVTVTDGNGCKVADTVKTTAGTNPNPMISGTLLFCPEDSTVLYAGSGYSSYLWSTGSVSDSIVVKIADNFSVMVSNADGCMGIAFASTSLYTAPIAKIDGKDGFCPSDSVLLTASGGISFLWSTGANTAMTYVNSPGVVFVTVMDANGCRDSASKSIIQFIPPTPFISGTLSFCDGGGATTLDAGIGYNSYLWSTGETSSAITVDTVGTYSLTVTDMNGCLGSANATVTEEGGLPAIPGPISGSEFGMCNTSTPSPYSVAPVPNSTCYIWRMPSGATIVSGFLADSNVFANSIDVVFDNSFVGGYIQVSAHNDCGAKPSLDGQ
ncbi:MAG: fibronectin type III domain-containing protein [Saprospiraceae bacterium]|nr:fibronectin type III domain-containing protein [Saprospiraceae bacterium]